MAKQQYEPPKQSLAGQTFDSLLLLALVFAALFVPFKFGEQLGLMARSKTALEFQDTTWKGLGQSEVAASVWEKLGYTPGAKVTKEDGTVENASSAMDIIAARFDYSFDLIALIVTALVVIAYFFIVIHFSKIEYRDVISEKFDK